MKLLFVHDVKALLYNNKVYARSYGKEIWERYLSAFDTIKVCTRCMTSSASDTKGIDQLECLNVTFDDRIGMFLGPDAFISKKVISVLREDISNADAMICRLDSFLGLIAIRECIRQNKPYIVEVVGCAWDSFWNHGFSGKILAPFLFYAMKRAVKNSKYVVYVTKEFLQHRYPTKGKSASISNVSIDTPSEDILNLRMEKIGQASRRKVHLYTVANVGVRYKGMHFVVKSLELLKQKGITNYIYHMVGEGNQEFLHNLAKQYGVEDSIVFHGPVSHDKVLQLLRDEADIYIQPSLQEGLPRSVIEAMSCALPCIGSDVAGIPELIDSEFIFARHKNIPFQIMNLIEKLDIVLQKEQAIINFHRSKEYSYPILRERRTHFLHEFVTENQNR